LETVIASVENFLSFICIDSIAMELDLVEFLCKPGNENWLRDLYDVERLIIFE